MEEMKVMLECITPRLVGQIMTDLCLHENEAFLLLYSSKFYAQLAREETKLWHLSVPMLYEMLKEELETGVMTYPEEV
ncbi:MAG: hypothetical protein LBM69_10925 [Lachnospiraceae bacterium]|nr:hypothetical protein [Lachnospiraceae bacterium]